MDTIYIDKWKGQFSSSRRRPVSAEEVMELEITISYS